MAEYSIADYGAMLTDMARMAAHDEALRLVIGPESVVVGAFRGVHLHDDGRSLDLIR